MIMNKKSNTAIFIENTMFLFIFNQCFSYDQNRINNLSKRYRYKIRLEPPIIEPKLISTLYLALLIAYLAPSIALD